MYHLLERAASLLEADSNAFAAAESADTGKPLRLASLLDVPRAVANLRTFARLVVHGELESTRHGGGAGRGSSIDDALNYTLRKPIGVVGMVRAHAHARRYAARHIHMASLQRSHHSPLPAPP